MHRYVHRCPSFIVLTTDFTIGSTATSPAMPYQPHLLYSPSPTSSDFKSPAFSFASTDTHEGMSEDGFSLERDAGDTYDRQAAAVQRRMVQERNQIVPAK